MLVFSIIMFMLIAILLVWLCIHLKKKGDAKIEAIKNNEALLHKYFENYVYFLN